MPTENVPNRSLKRTVSPAAAWAFSIGTSVGWGSLVVTNNTYLAQAGPAGSVLGMLIGAAVMLLISHNYAYMMNAFPEAGGAYAYSREVFGHDHGFLTAWFLALTYLAIFWANATALPLFARYFLGNLFHFGKLYTIFGYEVYLGEALLSIAAILLTALLCSRSKKIVESLMLCMAVLFTLGILVCLIGAVAQSGPAFRPGFVPESNSLTQIIRIACISPWAFIGFESISHQAEEFSFSYRKIRPVLIASVLITTALYIFVMLLSVTAYPPEYENWLAYIRDLGNLDGIKALPAFYAANAYLGRFGITVLMLALLALIFTSLIGNTAALSRLFYAMGKDSILPAALGKLNTRALPGNAIGAIALVSCVIPFLGRTAIGWIVDVTTLGATLIYGYVSASAMKLGRTRSDRTEILTGRLGLVISIAIGAYMLIPNLVTAGSMETESYFLFVVWAVLGFVYFRIILVRDHTERFGRSVVVWIALLSLVLFVSLVWMNQSIMTATDRGMHFIEDYYSDAGLSVQAGLVSSQLQYVRMVSARSILVVVALFALALGVLLNNYRLMSRRAAASEEQLGIVRDMANTDPLTGVRSKHAYTEREKELDSRIRAGKAEPFAMAVCDVNGLKYINDTFGHKAGDEYIRQACHIVCEAFSHSPVFRTGGDEFVVILGEHDYPNREAILREFRRQAEEHIASGDVVVSAGMAVYLPGRAASVHEVFEEADAAMYTEKKRLKSLGAVTRQ